MGEGRMINSITVFVYARWPRFFVFPVIIADSPDTVEVEGTAMEELGQRTVELSTVVSRAAEEAYLSLKELVETSRSSGLSDSEKKDCILNYLTMTRQRMLRLLVVAKWSKQVPLIQHCQQLASILSNHDTCFTQAADSMFIMHEGLQQACAPMYDIPSAMEVLLTGTYQRLPKCTEVGIQSTLTEDQQKAALKKLDTLVRSKLLEVSLPTEISDVKVLDGTAMFPVNGEFKVLVTLGYRGHLSLWRILHLELLVGERSGLVKLDEMRRHVLGDDLERRMAAAENPFVTLYSVLHELCVALVMDTVIRQVQALRLGRWKDAIRCERISDRRIVQGGRAGSMRMTQVGETDLAGLRIPGFKLFYWLDFYKNSGTSDAGSCPFIKIELGPDRQIKYLHSTFIIDPLTGKEAEFSLDQSCIDVEKLLLRAICCNRYTRLLKLYIELGKNSHFCRAAGDVLLHCHADEPDADYKKKDNKYSDEGQEILRVRAYCSSFFTLGINIRSGRFLLHSSGNILACSALLECEEALNQGSMSAAEVFISLRSKSILHLFACIGRFLGLEVYEHDFSAIKLPKDILNGPRMLLMRFPDCESSYFLLMQLDNDFKPLFKLLETRPDPSEKARSSGDLNHLIRLKNVDIGQMQMLKDELNLSLIDYEKLLSFSANDVGTNQTSACGVISEFSLEGSMISSDLSSSFSSIVDEVFELERVSSARHFSVQSPTSMFNTSPASHFGSAPMNLHSIKAGTSFPGCEGGTQISQINNITRVTAVAPNNNGSIYSSSNLKGMIQSGSTSLLSSGPGRSTALKKLSGSKSHQDLASLTPPHSAEVGSYTTMNEDQLTVSGNRTARLLSPPQPTGPWVSAAIAKVNRPRNSPNETLAGSSSPVTTPISQAPDSTIFRSSILDAVPRHDKTSGKRTVSDILNLVPTLRSVEISEASCKRRKICTQQPSSQTLVLSEMIGKTEGYNYANLMAEAIKGNAPSSIYVSVLLHVVRHCSLCIKHARLTSQMEALDIPYNEDVGIRNASSNLSFQLPFVRFDSWQRIFLRLGLPGSMYWDVKINDQYYRDLWEFQKGNSTPWGSGVQIANTSLRDSHIRYDAEGVVLSYNSVEADSIKKLVADIQRLSNARMFALRMRKLLVVRSDEKLEEINAYCDGKAPVVVNDADELADKFLEQIRAAFRIEAVGLMSLWFSFDSGVLAHFVVEWESGKDGCTMHVSPDQLWPHTKILENFINGGEVASLLDCIRLTAGPLHALAAATRSARAAPVSGVPSVASSVSSMSRWSGYTLSQGHLPSSSTTNTSQVSSGRGGLGIVPSSLFPIDVSVVLRGAYWIRIIYRKYFAVDMRCVADDQVWLQPATPTKGGPSVGGSLPCPQFRPLIMKHVAQELNGLDPNFTVAQQTVGLVNSNNSSPNSGPQLSAFNGNRVYLLGSAGMSRSGNQVTGINRVGNALPVSSNSAVVSSGLPLRCVRGELNRAIIGLEDDGGYGGGWVPLVALKKVLRGVLKYLGVLWLFAQLPDLLKEILGSILRDNEGALLNIYQERPALRFFVGGYIFSVNVDRSQLILQVFSIKSFYHSRQQNSAIALEELTQSEIGEIRDYFSRRVASEPFDISRVASFITLLTLPISVLKEFLKLIAWKKGFSQAQGGGGDMSPAQKPRIELCLENHSGSNMGKNSENSYVSKSNIRYDRPRNSVDFGLIVVLDPAHIPHVNSAGGAAWLPYCVSVRLRYSFGENSSVYLLGMEGSHGGRACWVRRDAWEKCKQRVVRAVEMSGDINQGRLRIIAYNVQTTLNICLKELKDGNDDK